ncbi:hypothetical protein ACFL0C_00360 [Patescibacteria group bacterium]
MSKPVLVLAPTRSRSFANAISSVLTSGELVTKVVYLNEAIDLELSQFSVIIFTSGLNANKLWLKIREKAVILNIPTVIFTLEPDTFFDLADHVLPKNMNVAHIYEKIETLAT